VVDESRFTERASRLRLVLTDCDGVLTDAGVYYSARGELMKRFSLRDGMGVERLRDAGIRTAIVSGEASPAIRKRAEKLDIAAYLGVSRKTALLDRILGEHECDRSAVAFIGDDVNDLPLMVEIGERGLTAAPADAMPDVMAVAHFRCRERGGHGAFREFAEWLLALRGPEGGLT